MDFQLNEEQKAIVDAVQSLMEQQGGPKRAIELQPSGGYDHALHGALAESGFMDVLRDPDMGPLEAALVTETIAAHAGVVGYAGNGVVLPGVSDREVSGAVAVTRSDDPMPLRFAAEASHVLVCGDDEARLVELGADDREALQSGFMYPMGRITGSLAGRGDKLGAGSGPKAQTLWRLALAAEAVGTMDAALNLTVEYVSNRRQFGRAIGSFQAVKHRLSLCKVQVEGARLLTYEAAFKGADPERVSTAAVYTMQAAQQVHNETHQLTGALGFTREHDLHVWSMRLQALRQELGGVREHRRALAAQRWGISA